MTTQQTLDHYNDLWLKERAACYTCTRQREDCILYCPTRITLNQYNLVIKVLKGLLNKGDNK
jgi:hypothetical protein